MLLRPVLGANFWEKLHYADRVEELWLDGIISRKTAQDNVPQSVVDYESKVVQGVELQREAARMMGAHLGPQEGGVGAERDE